MPHQMVAAASLEGKPTHYQVLELPCSTGGDSDLFIRHIKAAYRRALLQHHPDKTRGSSISSYSQDENIVNKTKPTYTIDQISEAYAILSVPKLRREYDQVLKLQPSSETTGKGGSQAFLSGFESLDLDDLAYDEVDETWYRGCRCGDERGFLIREPDLEDAADLGEIHVGCKGCSLWLRVLFGVIEEEAGGHKTNCD